MTKMPTLLATRGLPASGKTTFAKNYLNDHRNALRSNRDDLRASLFGGEGILSREQEDLITKVQQATVIEALKQGMDVVVDDMHLRPKYLRQWNEIANDHQANFVIKEFNTPIEECISYDAIRGVEGGRWLGEEIIRSIASKQMPKGKFFPYTPMEPMVWEPVKHIYGLQSTVIVDIDGTLTTGPHERGPFDWAKVGQDKPRRAVVRLVGDLLDAGYHVTFMSGRNSVCRPETEKWLFEHLLGKDDFWELHMRPEGDQRKDSIVKYELFNRHVRGKRNVRFVIDDRPQVCRVWRKIGVEVLQVGDPYVEF